MNPLEIKDDSLLVFLYRDIGLSWELKFSLAKAATSLNKNRILASFIRDNIQINILRDWPTSHELLTINSFYYKNSGPNKIGSLIKHLRNSIMHGNYKLETLNKEKIILFSDYYKDEITLIGKCTIKTLKLLLLSLS